MAPPLLMIGLLAIFFISSSCSSCLANDVSQIDLACMVGRFPAACRQSLKSQSHKLPPNPTPSQIVQLAIWVSTENLKAADSMVGQILAPSSDNLNRSRVTTSCHKNLKKSRIRSQSASDALPRGKVKDARAWYSAALGHQSGCLSGLKRYTNDSKQIGETVAFLNDSNELMNNTLSMMMAFDHFGDDFNKWRAPETERDGFWEKAGSGVDQLGSSGGFPSNLTADVTVCEVGSCDFKTVQDAVDAAPDNVTTKRFVINIKEGVYRETVRVPFEKKNVVFLGDGIGKTVITGSSNVGKQGLSTYDTATVGVLGDGFMARGLTIQNTAGSEGHQAVAFRSESDLSIIEHCEFLGNQDTLYAHSLRQFYNKCSIQGNVDFIFGNSAAVFQDCEILVAPRQEKQEKGQKNVVTAHGRTDPAQPSGFVFRNCLINGTEEYMRTSPVHPTYLGRPWREYARTVFINCNLEALVHPDGWMPWSGDFGLKTLYYGEFDNSGPGSDPAKRVPWSSQIPAEHVNVYSLNNFIQGDEWISASS